MTKLSARLAQDLVGLPQVAVLPLQGFQPLGDFCGDAGAHAAGALGPLHPPIKRPRRAADLPRRASNTGC